MQETEKKKLSEAEEYAVKQALKVFGASQLSYLEAVELLPVIEKQLRVISLTRKINMEDLRHL